jgi:tetratricopeptide (TPR) repeat protein
MAQRLTRKGMKHDKFIEDVELAYGFAGRHRAALLGGALGLLVIVLAAWGWVVWQSNREAKAQADLAAAITLLDSPVSSVPDPDSLRETFPTEEAKLAKAEPLLRAVASEYGSTDAAQVAGLYLARIEAARGDVAAAKPRLEKIVRSKPEELLTASAQLALFQIELGENPGEAIPKIEREVSRDKGLLPKDAALALLAQAYERAGDTEKSRATWRRILNEFPDSPYAGDAQNRISS